MAALRDQDPAYLIDESDYVASDRTLTDFLERFAEGYKPEHVADRILPKGVDSPQTFAYI
ncbi:hypothetical protein QE400_000032 [Xanthomonas sacchari]|uniref:hypothetical protein n=1 Tax=Xanthomonas sacchari TaxID=56458 RepID=UPI00277F6F28|nr:hypothetical protein [Xanthomonas sacchari]MDQ1090619.1 hypothetical protein [Xanthomonas sacchari]